MLLLWQTVYSRARLKRESNITMIGEIPCLHNLSISCGVRFAGSLFKPTDAAYDSARKVYNGMIDKRPRLIARCVDVADVIAAVKFGRENEMLTAIRGGGHNGAGLGTCDDGLVIDLSRMKGIRVDPADQTVRVEAGCVWGDVDHATHAFGMATPCGFISTTGVAGLTLGGGIGYLTRKLRPDDRQSALRRHGFGRWQLRDGEQQRECRSVLGGARRWRKLRSGHFLRISPPAGKHGPLRPDVLAA